MHDDDHNNNNKKKKKTILDYISKGGGRLCVWLWRVWRVCGSACGSACCVRAEAHASPSPTPSAKLFVPVPTSLLNQTSESESASHNSSLPQHTTSSKNTTGTTGTTNTSNVSEISEIPFPTPTVPYLALGPVNSTSQALCLAQRDLQALTTLP